MAINSKQKGAKFERFVASMFKDWGFDAHRTAQYCGNSGMAQDVMGVPKLSLECKSYKEVAVYKWYEQAEHDARVANKGDIPVVIFKGNNKPPMAMLSAEHFIMMYKEWLASEEVKNAELDSNI